MKSGSIFHNGIIATAIAATTLLSFSVHVTDATSQGEDKIPDVSLRGKRNEAQIEKDRLLMPNGDGRFHESNESENRIVGGTESAVGAFPYYVELLYKNSNSHYCGGTLISPRVVLTAAHCDQGYVGQNVLVGGYEVGVSNEHGTESIEVEAQVAHPNYNGNTLANDFLLLRLVSDAKVGTPRASISSTDDVNYPAAGTTSRVIGLGALSSGGGSPNILRDVNVPVVDPDTCDDMYRAGGASIEKDIMLCAGDIVDGGEDSCQGDSGGPLVIEQSSEVHELVGVVSWGFGCADRRYPGVYAKVGARNKWIQEVVCTQWGLSEDFCTAGSCDNVAGWYDSDGSLYDCNWYSNTANACSNYGDGYENFGYTANEACCACGGGTPRGDIITSPPTQPPTRVPTTSPTTSPTRSPTTSPTSPPTQSPTRSPTTSPTPPQTDTTPPPTRSPTRSPTTSPTAPPTRSPTPSPTTSPTAPPTRSPTPSPTTSPTAPPTFTGGTCADFSGWYDSDGEEYDCPWYSNTANACSDYGDDFENFGYTATAACCACGGGTLGDMPILTQPPTPSPTPAPTPAPTPEPEQTCCQCWGRCRTWCCW